MRPSRSRSRSRSVVIRKPLRAKKTCTPTQPFVWNGNFRRDFSRNDDLGDADPHEQRVDRHRQRDFDPRRHVIQEVQPTVVEAVEPGAKATVAGRRGPGSRPSPRLPPPPAGRPARPRVLSERPPFPIFLLRDPRARFAWILSALVDLDQDGFDDGSRENPPGGAAHGAFGTTGSRTCEGCSASWYDRVVGRDQAAIGARAGRRCWG